MRRRKIDTIWAKVVIQVRREAQKYPHEPDGYEDYVSHLQTIEDSLPGRKAAQPAGSSRGNQNNKISGNPDSATSRAQNSARGRGSHKRTFNSFPESKKESTPEGQRAKEQKGRSDGPPPRNVETGSSKNS